MVNVPTRLQGLPALVAGNTRMLGLWDVYDSCERQGSLGTAIRQPPVNDLAALKRRCPKLRLLAYNGG